MRFDRIDGFRLFSIWPPMRLLSSPGFLFAIALGVAVWLVPHSEGSVQPTHRVTCPASSVPLLVRGVEQDPMGAHLKRCGCVEGSAQRSRSFSGNWRASDRLRQKRFAVAGYEPLYKRPPPSLH
jgi:hypothetical protein